MSRGFYPAVLFMIYFSFFDCKLYTTTVSYPSRFVTGQI